MTFINTISPAVQSTAMMSNTCDWLIVFGPTCSSFYWIVMTSNTITTILSTVMWQCTYCTVPLTTKATDNLLRNKTILIFWISKYSTTVQQLWQKFCVHSIKKHSLSNSILDGDYSLTGNQLLSVSSPLNNGMLFATDYLVRKMYPEKFHNIL